jgi:hypothetical protein
MRQVDASHSADDKSGNKKRYVLSDPSNLG